MEGYSVTEAASILGVPTERVWELLARGVLAGTPEGDTGMRVFLQPRPAPEPRPMDIPPPPNGGRETTAELSPFRELLTEFRNLTERYGQALLALGEARGEVAALRSRVDLLEARMDLRLPMGSPAGLAPEPWPMSPGRTAESAAPEPPAPSRPAPQEAISDAQEAVAPPDAGSEDEAPEHEEAERPTRRRRQRRATESFAEALARAEDPTKPELPRAEDAVAGLAGLREAAAAEGRGLDVALPRELPGADEIPIPMEGEEAAAPELQSEPEPEPTVAAAEPEPEPPAVAAVEPEPEPQPVVEAAEPAPEPEPEAEREERQREPEEPQPGPEALEPLEWDRERYTPDLAEPDWLADEEPTAVRPEEALPPAAESPERRPDEIEEALLWLGAAEGESPDAGADEMEVVSSPVSPVSPVSPASPVIPVSSAPRPASPSPESERLPGAFELEEALAALDAMAGRRPPGAADPSSAPSPPPSYLTRTPGTPASRAYRRLRRIFPG